MMDLLEATPPKQQLADSASDCNADETDIKQNKDIAAFSYLWIMSVIVYLLRRKSSFVRFHSRQAMILCILSFAVFFVPIISKLLELVVLALMVLGFINAAQGQRKDIPIVGPLSRHEITIRQAWKRIIDAVVKLMQAFRSEKQATTAPAASEPQTPSAPTS